MHDSIAGQEKSDRAIKRVAGPGVRALLGGVVNHTGGPAASGTESPPMFVRYA